jgi:flagellar biogenesis protein FliO
VKYLILSALLATRIFGFEISAVKVSGEKEALIQFVGNGNKSASPNYKVTGNTVELTFANTVLSADLQGKLDVSTPHALIHRISLFDSGSQQVKAVVIVNGTVEGLKNRLASSDSHDGFSLKIDYPKNGNSTLELLKEEQLPLQDIGKETKKENHGFQWFQLFMFLFVVVAAGGATVFVVRFSKAKGNWGGSRKYLIEQLSYVPVGGNKSGVALMKVGGDFVLLGVTQNQVTFLSSLPKLSEQYEEENSFEKNTFKEAIQEQIRGKNFNV